MDLSTPIDELPFVGPYYQKKLTNLQIININDLLRHVPRRYIDFSRYIPIIKADIGEVVTLRGEIDFIKNQYTKTGKKIQIAQIKDESSKITIVWFNQPFLTKTLFPGDILTVSGEISWFGRQKAIISPEYEKGKKSLHTGRILPIYPETKGLSSKWLRSRIKYAIENITENIKEIYSKDILKDYNLPTLDSTIKSIHYPKSLQEAEQARKRLAFDELLAYQIESEKRRKQWSDIKIKKNKIPHAKINQFISKLPFTLTSSQQVAISDILKDMEKSVPMNRLLEGDVGSGKTVVACCAIYACYLTGKKSIIMAPTQILAEQHYQVLTNLLSKYHIKTTLVTSKVKNINEIESADLIVGTHALLHLTEQAKSIGLVVIDEQHKFGVEQRNHLIKKSGSKLSAPHVLTMTATPIPRTVALTAYGDMDLSALTQLPKGRQKISTWIVEKEKREDAYTWIKDQIRKTKTQVFVVCPLIEASDKETMQQVKSVKKEYGDLTKSFLGFKLGLLHGKLSKDDKNTVLNNFREGKVDILVTTPVVEVGIDIPNANIMLIETAERFGLAQLHQLRGRIGRGKNKSYALLFTETVNQKIKQRLKALQNVSSGFELAEIDLSMRGPGEIFGIKQSGFPELKVASWQDTDIIVKTKKLASELITEKKRGYKVNINLLPQSRISV